ncbi:hypothetical protein [Photobacterium sp. OFAV2-7]|uniref:hypothetical protein n=1 Tax=Photobacterium sp. OFAV2-7 TaxID=2917748 RepID=UPI001EF43B7B|nr:hypothetical protein [Photobacterium sp. OFAV2-7]MCG7584586.1 hypothetical protein [Photobacterium sp. OFAV2-7]
MDKSYDYRPDDENWTVYSITDAGTEDESEDWVATVSTESVAELLINALETA